MIMTYKVIRYLLVIVLIFLSHTLCAMPEDCLVRTLSEVSGEEHKSVKKVDDGDINRVCYKALEFFRYYFRDGRVINAIACGIKDCPDRVIKLLFFCLDSQERRLFNRSLRDKIQSFIHKKIPGSNLCYLSFRSSCTGMPMFWVLQSSCDRLYDDIYEKNFNKRITLLLTSIENHEFEKFMIPDTNSDEKQEVCSNAECEAIQANPVFQALIQNYLVLRDGCSTEEMSVIIFFKRIIQNKQLLDQIVEYMRYDHKKIMKLYCFCLYYYKTIHDDFRQDAPGEPILDYETFKTVQFSIKFIKFWRFLRDLPDIEMRQNSPGFGLCDDELVLVPRVISGDRYELVSPDHEKSCVIL